MTSDEAHNSHHPLPSKPIRGQSEATNNLLPTSLATNNLLPTSLATNNLLPTSLATNNLLPTSPENQLFDGFYFDDDKLCPQCGQDHSYKLTGGERHTRNDIVSRQANYIR